MEVSLKSEQMTTLDQLQVVGDRWIQANGGYWTSYQILARLTEELGEVAEALQRTDGLRLREVDVSVDKVGDDLLYPVAAFANRTGIDLSHAIALTIAKYDDRDRAAWQVK
jgi:NTP pyrophosphatase (non-canonical NTP hydrolase)